MPRKSLETAEEIFQQGSSFMVPAGENDVANLSVIHAMRSMSDAVARVADSQAKMSDKIDTMAEGFHNIDKRLAVIEANSLSSKVESHDERLSALEEKEQRRQGAIGFWEFLLKSWPAVLGFLVLLGALVASGKIRL